MIKMKKAFLLAASMLVGTGGAFALDVNEVAQLVQNGVQDTVIINMVQSQKLDRPLTANDVLALDAAGASGHLLEYMTRPDAVSSSYVVSPSPMIVESPQIQVQQAPTVVTTQPTVVYGSACATPRYVYPYSSPYYYYSVPYYDRRPSYSFSFSLGSWGRSHYRHPGGHRGGPPGGHRGGGRGHRR